MTRKTRATEINFGWSDNLMFTTKSNAANLFGKGMSLPSMVTGK